MAAEGHSLAEYKSGHARDSSVLSGSFPHPNAGVAEDDRSPLVSGGSRGAGQMRGGSEEDIGETRPLHQPPPYNSSTALEGYSDQTGQQWHSRGRLSVYDTPGYGYGHHNEQTAYDPLAHR